MIKIILDQSFGNANLFARRADIPFSILTIRLERAFDSHYSTSNIALLLVAIDPFIVPNATNTKWSIASGEDSTKSLALTATSDSDS